MASSLLENVRTLQSPKVLSMAVNEPFLLGHQSLIGRIQLVSFSLLQSLMISSISL